MKVASFDKSASLVARIAFTNSMVKVAKQVAIKDYTEKLAMNKQADLGQSLSDAWKGVQDWWSKPENQAGLATGALGGLATYGLTGLIPGLKRNQAARLGLAGLGAFGGYKGGQWGANYFSGKGEEKGYNRGAADTAEEADKTLADVRSGFEKRLADADANAKAQEAKYKGDIDQLNATIATGSDRLNAANAQIGDLSNQLTAANDKSTGLEKQIADLNAQAAESAKAQAALQGKIDEQTAAALAAQQAFDTRLADAQKGYDENMARIQADLDAANAQNTALKGDMERSGQAETLRLAQIGGDLESRRKAEGQQLEDNSFAAKVNNHVVNLIKNGPLSQAEAANQIQALEAQKEFVTSDAQLKSLDAAIQMIQRNTVAPEKAQPTFQFGNRGAKKQ